MNRYDCRIALRLASNEKEKLEELIRERKFKNLSQLIRTALNEFLNKSEVSGKQFSRESE
jgi:Arc/MetJ-type ribon-helix-helix transcriptional regulator